MVSGIVLIPGLKAIPTTKFEFTFARRSPLCQSRRVGGEGLGVRIRILGFLAVMVSGIVLIPVPFPYSAGSRVHSIGE